MPIFGEPFCKNSYGCDWTTPKDICWKTVVLVISDYATRYPETYAMTTITTKAVAEKLMDQFSCHGVPREILINKGTNFMSELLQEPHKLLKVKSVCTSLFHPQTDGLVE